MLARFGDELMRDASGVGGMGDLGERRPIGAAGIERIEDDVAASGPVVVRDELAAGVIDQCGFAARLRSEEHTSELQSLMRISYAVFCLKKKIIHRGDTTCKIQSIMCFSYAIIN